MTPTPVPLFADYNFQDFSGWLNCVFYSQRDVLTGCNQLPVGGQVAQGFISWDVVLMSVAVIVGASIAAFAISQLLRRLA